MFDRYVIQNGENLDIVARKFKTDAAYLKDINNIYYDDEIKSGTEIIVPKEKENYFEFYKVGFGDTLFEIARKYNINPELLANMNGLNMNDYIYENQEILIPKGGYSYYITKEGDTLDTVANLFNVETNILLDHNETIYLLPGQLMVNKK